MKNWKVRVRRGNQIICEEASFISIWLIMSVDVAKVSICLTALKYMGIFLPSCLCKCELCKDKIIHTLYRLLINFFREPPSLQKSSSDSFSLKYTVICRYILKMCDKFQS